jgi:hypothetical protein
LLRNLRGDGNEPARNGYSESAARWASVSVPTLIVDVPLDGLGVLSGSALLTTQSLPTGLSNGEIDDHPVQNDKQQVHQQHREGTGRSDIVIHAYAGDIMVGAGDVMSYQPAG